MEDLKAGICADAIFISFDLSAELEIDGVCRAENLLRFVVVFAVKSVMLPCFAFDELEA